jgi:hypothetical protein
MGRKIDNKVEPGDYQGHKLEKGKLLQCFLVGRIVVGSIGEDTLQSYGRFGSFCQKL